MALNAKTENAMMILNIETKNAMMILNIETEKRWWRLLMPKLRSNDGSERRNWETMMAMNAKLKVQGDNEGEICPSVACCYNSQSTEMVWKRLHESQMMLC